MEWNGGRGCSAIAVAFRQRRSSVVATAVCRRRWLVVSAVALQWLWWLVDAVASRQRRRCGTACGRRSSVVMTAACRRRDERLYSRHYPSTPLSLSGGEPSDLSTP